MKAETFDRELRYQTMIAICRAMQKSGAMNEQDFTAAEAILNEKYRPIFRAQ